MPPILWAVVGAIIGAALAGAVVWAALVRRASAAQATVEELRRQTTCAAEDFDKLRKDHDAVSAARIAAQTELAEARKSMDEQRKLLDEARTKLADSFKALSADALKSNNQQFLELAQKTLEKLLADTKGELGKHKEALTGLLKPLHDDLVKYEKQVQAIEASRQKAYGTLEEQVRGLAATHQQLQKETAQLVTALRRPEVRGRWGEISLRRVVELAGMSQHCDYTEQVSVESEDGRLRPDMVVHMPAGRDIVVDAKVSLSAYLTAAEAESEEERRNSLALHARQMREHVRQLSAKAYWDQFERSPEFVVMFIPGESFFGAAAERDPDLIEDAMQQRVVLATPTTLIALLRAIAYGWRQELIAQNARDISDLGRDLFDRMRTLAEHIGGIGEGLKKSTEAYNSAVGSLERRVLPAARRFRDLGVGTGKPIPPLEPVDSTLRELTAPETDGEQEQ